MWSRDIKLCEQDDGTLFVQTENGSIDFTPEQSEALRMELLLPEKATGFRTAKAAEDTLKNYQNALGESRITGLVYRKGDYDYRLIALYFGGDGVSLWEYNRPNNGDKIFEKRIL